MAINVTWPTHSSGSVAISASDIDAVWVSGRNVSVLSVALSDTFRMVQLTQQIAFLICRN